MSDLPTGVATTSPRQFAKARSKAPVNIEGVGIQGSGKLCAVDVPMPVRCHEIDTDTAIWGRSVANLTAPSVVRTISGSTEFRL
jgi:hypothetical protein